MVNKKRDFSFDLFKGILIIFVVAAHFQRDIIHDVIFLFHMPLFFILSGFFLKKDKLVREKYLKSKLTDLLVPYCAYLLLDFLLIQRDYSFRSFVRLIYGGRAITGTYWYITCFLFALAVFSFYQKYFSDKVTKCLIFAGGGIVVIESHLAERIGFLKSPGVPWNLDVALLALVYLAIGYYNKERIRCILKSDGKKYDVVTFMTAAALTVFCCFNYQDGEPFYYFDMKPVYYYELFSAVIIPCAFGFVIVRMIHWIVKCKIFDWLSYGLAYLGQMTIPIMFLHVPLNNWKDSLGYGRFVYVLIGVGIPVVFTVIFNRFHVVRRLFGLPEIKRYPKVR